MALWRNDLAAMAICLTVVGCGPNSANETPAGASVQSEMTTADSAAKPEQIGDCVETKVAWLGPRLEGVPGSGSAIQYQNGMRQVEYDAVAGIDRSQIGDDVRVCLVSAPESCPAGDDRGRVYSGTNLRTGESWSAPDSEHMCGGA